MTLNYTSTNIWGREVDRSDTINSYSEEEVKKALRYVKMHYGTYLHLDDKKHTTIYWELPEEFNAGVITVVTRPQLHEEYKCKMAWQEMRKRLQY